MLTRPRTRDEVHALGLYHRGIVVWVLSQNDILLQQRSDQKDICPSLWDVSVAGHVGAWESYRAAAARETREELGLRNVVLKKICAPHLNKQEYLGGEIKDYEYLTTFVCTSRTLGKLDKGEVQRADFFAIEKVKSWVAKNPAAFTPWFLAEWEFMKKFLRLS